MCSKVLTCHLVHGRAWRHIRKPAYQRGNRGVCGAAEDDEMGTRVVGSNGWGVTRAMIWGLQETGCGHDKGHVVGLGQTNTLSLSSGSLINVTVNQTATLNDKKCRFPMLSMGIEFGRSLCFQLFVFLTFSGKSVHEVLPFKPFAYVVYGRQTGVEKNRQFSDIAVVGFVRW